MHLPLLLAGIAVIVLSAVVMTSAQATRWIHDSMAVAGELFAPVPLPDAQDAAPSATGTSEARLKGQCDECGVIDSVRALAPVGDLPASYEIKVRMSDGSIRTLSDASPASWRRGERIKLIGGTSPPGK